MAFVDHSEFEAMKTLIGRTTPCCGKDQFRAKMMVRLTQTVCEISLLSIICGRNKKNEKNGTFMTAHFCV